MGRPVTLRSCHAHAEVVRSLEDSSEPRGPSQVAPLPLLEDGSGSPATVHQEKGISRSFKVKFTVTFRPQVLPWLPC